MRSRTFRPSVWRVRVPPQRYRALAAACAASVAFALGAEPFRWEPAGPPLPLAESFSHFEFLDDRTLVLVDPRTDAPARSFWDLETGALIGAPRHDPRTSSYLDLRPDRSRALGLSEHGRLVLVALDASAAPALVEDDSVFDARFSPDGAAAIAILGRQGVARVARIELKSGKTLWKEATPGPAEVVLLPAIERVLMLEPKYDGSIDERYSAIVVRDAKTGAVVSSVDGPIRGFRKFGPQFASARFAVVEKTGGFIIVDGLDGSVAEVDTPASVALNLSRLAGGGALLAVHESSPNAVRIFDCQTGQPLASISGAQLGFWPDGALLRLAASPDSARIYYADGAAARALDVATGTVTRSFALSAGNALGVAVSPDGKTVAAATDAGAVEFWSAESGQSLATAPFEGFLASSFGGLGESEIQFSPDGNALVVGGGGSKVALFRTPPLAGRISTIRGEAALVAPARDLDRYFVYFADGSVEWRARGDFSLIGAREAGDRSDRVLAASTANGVYVTASFSVRTPYTGETLWAPGGPGAEYGAAWISDDGSAVAARESSGPIWIKKIGSALPAQAYALPPGGYAIAGAFAPDGSCFAALVADGDEQRSIRILDLSGSPPTERVAEPPAGARALLFSADGETLLALGSNDSTLRLLSLDPATGESTGFIEAKVAGPFDELAFSGEDDLYFAYGYDGRITLIDVSTGQVSQSTDLARSHEAGGSTGFATERVAALDSRRFLYLESSGMVSGWSARAGRLVPVALAPEDGGLAARVAPQIGATYLLEVSPDLVDWADHAEADAGSAELSLPFPQPDFLPVFGRVWEFENP